MREKVNLFFVFLGFFAAFCLVFPSGGQAFDLDSQGKYQLGGYIENMTGVRMADSDTFDQNGNPTNEKGDLSMCRNVLFLNFGAKFSRKLQLKVIARGHYDAVFDLDSRVNDLAEGEYTWPGPDPLNYERDFDFREYYITWMPGDFVFKFGRQQVAWGEADNMRLADIINPLDLSWRSSFPTWEEIRIPQLMLNVVYNVPGSAHNLRFEGVWNPGDFRTHQYAPIGANWDFYSLIGAPVWFTQALRNQQKADMPKRKLKNSEFGMRIRGEVNGWDMTAFGYYQRDQLGINRMDPWLYNFLSTGVPPSSYGPDGEIRDLNSYPVRTYFPRIFTVGGTFAKDCQPLATVFRGEGSYVFNQPFTIHNMLPMFPGATFGDFNMGDKDYEEKDVVSFMFGFDHNHQIPFVNKRKTVWFSGQVFQKFVLDYDSDNDPLLITYLGDNDRESMQTIGSLMIQTEYLLWSGYITPQVVIVDFFTSNSGFVDFSLSFVPKSTVAIGLGYLNIFGNQNNAGLYFGPIRKNDEIYASVKWDF